MLNFVFSDTGLEIVSLLEIIVKGEMSIIIIYSSDMFHFKILEVSLTDPTNIVHTYKNFSLNFQ